jgi:hypothetical protein
MKLHSTRSIHRKCSRQCWLSLLAILLAVCPAAQIRGQDETSNRLPKASGTPENKIVTKIKFSPGIFSSAAISPSSKLVYVASASSSQGSVYEISAKEKKVTKTYSTSLINMDGIAITPSGKEIWVSGIDSSSSVPEVEVLNAQTGKSIAIIGIGDAGTGNSGGVSLTPNGTQAWVINTTPTNGSFITVIDTSTNSVVSNIAFPDAASEAGEIAFSPDGTTAYVPMPNLPELGYTGPEGVYTVDVSSEQFTGVINTGVLDSFVTVCKTNGYVFAGRYPALVGDGGNVDGISVYNGETVQSISTPAPPGVASVLSDGDYLYVPYYAVQSPVENMVVMYDVSTGAQVGNPIDAGGWQVAIAPNQKTAYIIGLLGVTIVDIKP